MKDMDVIKKFFERLDIMLENDKDIDVNSVEELVEKANKATKE